MKRRTFLAATGATGALAGLTACGGGDDSSGGGSSSTLTLATVVAPQPWDPKDAGLGNNAIYYQPVYDALLSLSATAEIGANLATEWAWDDSLTVLTLTLRDDVKFTDGTALDAAAVKANLDNTRTGTNEAATNLVSVASVDVVDATHVTVTVSAPDPSLLSNLATVSGMIASPTALTAGSLGTTPVGSGPYVLATSGTTAGTQYTFTRNADYWNADAFPFDTIVFKYLSDPTALVNALRSGQLDGGIISDYKNAAPLKSAGLDVVEYDSSNVDGFYIFDRAGTINPALADVRVRQAINHAFDRDTILATAKGGLGEVTEQIFNPSSTAYVEALNETYPYDVEKAKSLLAEAGQTGFELVIPDLSLLNAAGQAAVVESLTAIGIKVTVDTVPADQLINALLGAKYAASYFQLSSFASWDSIRIQVAPDSLWNLFKYEDPKVSDLITRGQNATGDDQADLFQELNTYLVQQAWNAPWTAVKGYYASSSKVSVTMRTYAPGPWIYDFTPAS